MDLLKKGVLTRRPFLFLTGGFKLISYSRWKSCLVMSNQQPVSSLGSEAVMSGVSVDKRTLEP